MKRESRRWLVLDVNYMCYRNFYSVGFLSNGEDPTGTVFGFMRDWQILQDAHATTNVIFCFDYGEPLRTQLLPTYKASRKEKRKKWTKEEMRAWKGMKRQVDDLREKYLPRLGCQNVFFEEGYEADDIIASVCKNMDDRDRAIIVSADEDLFQLINENVSVWNQSKQRMMNLTEFTTTYGITPDKWPKVKAIAGCSSDDVPGLEGVGEKTAIRYISGTLNPESKAYKQIKQQRDIWKPNLKLVRLPYKDCPDFSCFVQSEVDRDNWNDLMSELGINSLHDNGVRPEPKKKRRGLT